MSGDLFKSGKTTQVFKGQELEHMLSDRGIDLNKTVPFSALTNKAMVRSYGVVKINNVSFTRLEWSA